ncbi:hypothetical protein [Mesorhizobium sp. M0767]|uniref:hypothetical protein n=1 Tax=Mesorhizobium sp. M0767 TaxID=2956995 RepID=UPI00333A81CA
MPNTLVRAAAEGMPSISRSLIAALAALPASAGLGSAIAAPEAPDDAPEPSNVPTGRRYAGPGLYEMRWSDGTHIVFVDRLDHTDGRAWVRISRSMAERKIEDGFRMPVEHFESFIVSQMINFAIGIRFQ